MRFSRQAWDQLKNKTCDDLIGALERDGWARDITRRGAILVYRHSDGRRVTIHYHPGKTYGRKLLEGLFEDIGWSESDLRGLKLIR